MLEKQVISIPIAEGVDTKTDSFQVTAGKALALENVRFYKTGKLQKRFGLSPLLTTTQTGSLSDLSIRAIASDDKALNIISTTGAYALSNGAAQWDKLSDMSDMIKVKSDYLSKSAYNQYNPDQDFNEELGMVATAFREVQENTILPSPYSAITVVIEDIETGVRKIRRLEGDSGYQNHAQKVMLVLDSGVIYFHLFCERTTGAFRHVILDKNLDTVSDVLLDTFAADFKFDCCRDGSNIYLSSMSTNSIKNRKISFNGTILTTVSTTVTRPLGINLSTSYRFGFSTCLTASNLHVFWIASTATYPAQNARLVGTGFLKSTLANTIAETVDSSSWPGLKDLAITSNGSVISIATSEFTPLTVGVGYRVNKFSATFTTSYVITEPSILDGAIRAVIISRPFVVGPYSYVVCKCPEPDQTTGFVYNLDTQKFSVMFSPFSLTKSRQIFTTFSSGTCNATVFGEQVFTATEKAYAIDTNSGGIDFNASSAIAKVELDHSNDLSSGTKTKVGETIYYTNGATFALDSRGCYESGFYIRPLIKSASSNTSGATTPAVAAKTFNYVAVYTYFNGKGEIERSIPSPAVAITTAANTTYVEVLVSSLSGSYKPSYYAANDARYTVEVVLYRTQNNGATFYRVSSVPTGQFGYSITMYDAASDAAISNNEILYTSGGVLENDSTPNAKFSTSGGNRLFLGGLEEEDEIAYSKKQQFGEAIACSDFFRIRISSGTSSDKSRMAALGYLDGKLIIFRENSIYYISGDGPLETGTQDTFTEPEVISSDTGCIEPRSVVNVPSGLLFKSKKGIYRLDRSLQVSYVGAPVEDFNNQGIVSAIVSDKFNEAKFYTESGRCLVYNYYFDKWSSSLDQTPIDADIWMGSPVQLINAGVSTEDESVFLDNGTVYPMKFTTPWLKLNGLQDFSRIWKMLILGTYKSEHELTVNVYYDYDDSFSDSFTITPLVTDDQYQYDLSMVKQKCEAIKFEIFDSAIIGESMELSGLSLEVGIKSGSNKLAATRKY